MERVSIRFVMEGGRRKDVCRVALLLALAHRVERALDAGEVADHSAAARDLGISPAHMSQIANLLHLAPDLQEALVTGRLHASENQLRAALRSMVWEEQRATLAAREAAPRGASRGMSPMPDVSHAQRQGRRNGVLVGTAGCSPSRRVTDEVRLRRSRWSRPLPHGAPEP